MPSISFGRFGRVVCETETHKRSFSLINASTSEVLPAPDGAETMISSPLELSLLNVLYLLAHLLDKYFHFYCAASRLDYDGF